jgi:hypothetical protein
MGAAAVVVMKSFFGSRFKVQGSRFKVQGSRFKGVGWGDGAKVVWLFLEPCIWNLEPLVSRAAKSPLAIVALAGLSKLCRAFSRVTSPRRTQPPACYGHGDGDGRDGADERSLN